MSWGSERNFRIKYGHASTCRKVDRFRGRYILHPTRECNCKDANGEFKTPLPYDEIRRYGLEPVPHRPLAAPVAIDPNPAAEIAEALAREVRMTDDLKWRLVEASKTEKSLRALLAQAEEALELIATCQVQADTWYGTALAQRSHAQRALTAVREGR